MNPVNDMYIHQRMLVDILVRQVNRCLNNHIQNINFLSNPCYKYINYIVHDLFQYHRDLVFHDTMYHFLLFLLDIHIMDYSKFSNRMMNLYLVWIICQHHIIGFPCHNTIYCQTKCWDKNYIWNEKRTFSFRFKESR